MSENDNVRSAEETQQPITPDGKTKVLAFLCKVCPFCIAARAFPDSAYAKAMRKAEAECPACRAYDALYGSGNEKQS
ncbi:MAG: hypothetical protein EOM20_01765 [Spartobacteria bacterium]|nr:hypothetical protein [Spartobacteria bacterium]